MGNANLILLLLSATAAAQTVPPLPQFEVASIHAVKPDAPEPIDARAFPGGRIVITNCNLRVLIMEAYSVPQYRIAGGPAWIDSERFDITASAGAGAEKLSEATRDLPPTTKLMLQALLTERFQLKLHRENRDGQVYHLVIAKGGPKLGPRTRGDQASVSLRVVGARPGNAYAVVGRNASMSMLAERLGRILGKPVVDDSGVEGAFDFHFEYTADVSFNDATPDVLTAIRDIGLQLEPRKGPVDTIVVESANRPSEN